MNVQHGSRWHDSNSITLTHTCPAVCLFESPFVKLRPKGQTSLMVKPRLETPLRAAILGSRWASGMPHFDATSSGS